MAERSKSLRIRRNSVTSDVVEIPDKHAAIVTPTKRRKNISNDCGVNKSDDQTSFSKRLTRAGSEAKSLPTITRPTRRTRASSMEPEAIKKSNVIEITNSGLAYNSVTIRKQRSPLHPAIIEGREETMTSIVALDHVLPNLNETNKTYSDNSTIEESNKSMSISKDTFNSSFENRCKEGVEADVYAKKEHANPAEHPAAKALQENETGMSINKNTFSDIREKSRSDSTDTITQMKTSIPDVPKTQSRISTEVTPRKLRLKNESSTNNSIKEDEHFSNKENQASNIIEDTQNKDLPVSNILSQSPQPLLVSDVCMEKSVKENDESTVIFTDTESLSKTSLNDSMDRRISCIDTCDDSDENLRILKCPANVNNINLLSPLNNDEDQNALSVEIRDDSNQDGGIQIEKYEENINDTHTDECSGFDKNKKEQIQHITSEDETIAKDENVGKRLILEADETANIDKEDRKEVCLTEIATANAKCEGNNQVGVSITPENLNDTGVLEYSKLPDTSVEKISTSLIISTDETDDLQETEVAAKVPSHQSITKEPFDVHTQSNNFELANENENNITNVSENSHSSNVTQSLVESIDEALKNVDVTQNTSKVDNCPASEEKSIIDSNSPNNVEKNEIAKTVRKREENMQVDDNISDAHIDTDLFQDIPADEWKERNSDKNSVHSMSTERLENEGENERDDFVLVDKEISQTAENINIEKEKESFDYDSDDTVLLKAQQNALKEKTVERMDMSESQCNANENKSAEVKDAHEKESMQQEEIIAAEAKSENEKEHVENQTEEIQNAENVSMRTSVSKESPPESDTSIEKPVDTTLTNEIDQTLDTESALNKRKCKGKLSEDMSNERKSVCKSVEKSDGEVEEPSEVDTVEEKDSLSKSPIGSPTNVSGSSITYESIDSDIEREYNLNGVEVCQFSDDDVPGDECRASETESSDPDDNGSDLADFVVNDDDEISEEEEVESSEFDEESYNGHDDKHRESDTYAMDEQRGKIQMQDESYEKRMNNGKQKKIDRGISKKEKSKCKRSVKLSLDKITESGKKMTNSKIGTIDKKRKRNKTKRWVEDDEIDEKELAEQCQKVQIHEEIAKKVTKKGQCLKEENVERIQNNCTGIPKKEKSKLRKTTKLDLSEMSESGKNNKRKFEIETGNKMKKIKGGDNDSTMQKENAIPTWRKYENSTVKSNKMELWRKRVRNLLEEVSSSPSGFIMHKSKKRKLNTEDLPSRSILHSVMKKSDINVKQDFTSLSLYGSTTNFYVTNIQKLKKRKNALEMQLHRHRMLNRKARLLNYIMFLEKR